MVTFEQYNSSTISEGWVWELVKFADPTGITSVPDLISAFTNYTTDRSIWKLIWLILCIVAVLPVAKYAGKGLSKAIKPLIFGAKETKTVTSAAKASASTAKNIAQAEAQLAKTVDLLIKGETTVSKALGKLNLPQQGVKSFFTDLKAFKQNPSLKAALAAGKTGAKKVGQEVWKHGTGSLETALTSPGLMKTGYGARLAKLGVTGGTGTAEGIKKQLDPYKTPESQRLTVPGQQITPGAVQTAQASAGAQQEPEEMLTYTDPKTGQQYQGTADEFKSLGILPIQAPQQQSYPLAGTGIQLTPAQQQAIGGFIPRGGTQRTGQITPQNVPQGATQQNPFGREGMSPAEYMRPDNFNNPPIPQQYQYQGNQGYGLGNVVGDIGNTVAGTVGGIGALAGQLAATPIAGVTNLASSLLGLIPGIGGTPGMGGMNPYQMAPASNYYRSPAGYNPYNYSPYGYPQR